MESRVPSEPEDQTTGNSAAVFEQYRERIYRYIVGLVHDSVEADDLLQETFLRVHRRLDSLKDPANLSVWLYRTATHVCYDRFRQASRRSTTQSLDTTSGHDDTVLVEDVDTPSLLQVIERSEMSACIREFVEQLPDDYRMTILLHDLHGMTNAEIAGALGCSLATVKIRLHRARQKLKATLTAGCDFSCDERGVFVCDRKPRKTNC